MNNGSGNFVDTNAYSVPRCGSASLAGSAIESTVSLPVAATPQGSFDIGSLLCDPPVQILETLWYADPSAATPAPRAPAVALWDGNSTLGTSQYDPAFIGEYLRTVTPVHASYRDWRLLPGSQLKDKGYWGDDNVFQHLVNFEEDPCDMLEAGLWDHESYGSPRIIDETPDIGFDEIHLAVIAGSYVNGSLSHNWRSFLNPFVYDDEQAVRFAILPLAADSGQQVLDSRTLKFVGNEKVPSNPPSNGSAWTKPPGSLTTPIVQAGSPADYNQIFTARGNPLPWMQSFTAVLGTPNLATWPSWQGAPGQQLFDFYLVSLGADDEGAGVTSWLNIQPYVYKSGFPVLWGNMQPEFR